MGCESFDVVRFDLGPLLQGQMRVAKLKSAYNLLRHGFTQNTPISSYSYQVNGQWSMRLNMASNKYCFYQC